MKTALVIALKGLLCKDVSLQVSMKSNLLDCNRIVHSSSILLQAESLSGL